MHHAKVENTYLSGGGNVPQACLLLNVLDLVVGRIPTILPIIGFVLLEELECVGCFVEPRQGWLLSQCVARPSHWQADPSPANGHDVPFLVRMRRKLMRRGNMVDAEEACP